MMFAHDLSHAKRTQTTLNEIEASTKAKNRAATIMVSHYDCAKQTT